MRIITRPDFDGVVCAVLLRDVLGIREPVAWVEPYELSDRAGMVKEGDIIANLPYVDGCALWFDHHYSNTPAVEFEGAFALAPSAARVIYDYYRGRFTRDFAELVAETDRVDSAGFTIHEVLHPEQHPYILLAFTISGAARDNEAYWNRVVGLLSEHDISAVMSDAEVQMKCSRLLDRDRAYGAVLKEYTVMKQNITITDFRPLAVEPKGNRFLIYSLFPDSLVDVKIRYDSADREKVIVSLGRNIFSRSNNVHLGHLVSRYGGGGHKGAGSCHFHASEAEEKINEIITILVNDVAIH